MIINNSEYTNEFTTNEVDDFIKPLKSEKEKNKTAFFILMIWESGLEWKRKEKRVRSGDRQVYIQPVAVRLQWEGGVDSTCHRSR